jgi:hypothetical protein
MASRSTIEGSAQHRMIPGSSRVRNFFTDKFKSDYCRLMIETLERGETLTLAQKLDFCVANAPGFDRPNGALSISRILRRYWDNRNVFLTAEELARYADLQQNQSGFQRKSVDDLPVPLLPLVPAVPLFHEIPNVSGEQPLTAPCRVLILFLRR